jgi:cysteinyl-tRNA synthetase
MYFQELINHTKNDVEHFKKYVTSMEELKRDVAKREVVKDEPSQVRKSMDNEFLKSIKQNLSKSPSRLTISESSTSIKKNLKPINTSDRKVLDEFSTFVNTTDTVTPTTTKLSQEVSQQLPLFTSNLPLGEKGALDID